MDVKPKAKAKPKAKKARWAQRSGNINLNTRTGYDIATGLRGPDMDGQEARNAKRVTTAVLRWLAGCGTECAGLVSSPSTAQKVWAAWDESTRDEVRQFIKMHNHFRWHVMDALYALGAQGRRYLAWLERAKVLHS